MPAPIIGTRRGIAFVPVGRVAPFEKAVVNIFND
jgi:hypothetical protein